MRSALILCLLPLVAGCGATVRETHDQFGERALRIECGEDIRDCHAKAHDVCRGGYDVLQTGENRTVVESGTPGNRQSTVMPENLMNVRCR